MSQICAYERVPVDIARDEIAALRKSIEKNEKWRIENPKFYHDYLEGTIKKELLELAILSMWVDER